MAERNILTSTSERLGIRDPPTIRKSEAFLRVLNAKGVLKTCSDAAKAILCLDLAATNLGVGFDKQTAFKLAGLKKVQYQNNLHIVEKILDLDKPITISELCVQLSCVEAKETAENILRKYTEHDSKINDINHPQYVSVAVFAACKIKQIKVQKAEFISISRLKRDQWNKLFENVEKFATAIGLSANKKHKSKRQTSIDENDLDEENAPTVKSTKKDKENDEIEEYEVWKQRILQEATAEILQEEIKYMSLT